MPRHLMITSFCGDHVPPYVAVDTMYMISSKQIGPAKKGDLLTIAWNLSRLPPEITHQIFDCLPLFNVLQLASNSPNGGYVHDCILGHLPYHGLFPNLESLNMTLDLFALYNEMGRFFHRLKYCMCRWGWRLGNRSFYLSDVNFIFYPEDCTVSISFYLRRLIERMLDLPTGLSLNLLEEYSKEQLPQNWNSEKPLSLDLDPVTCRLMRQRCIAVRLAEKSVNRIRSMQLYKLADLLTEFPTMLKIASDPSQTSRLNTGHIVSRLRKDACSVLGDQQLVMRFRPREWFTFNHFALVPFDSYLRLFVHALDRYP